MGNWLLRALPGWSCDHTSLAGSSSLNVWFGATQRSEAIQCRMKQDRARACPAPSFQTALQLVPARMGPHTCVASASFLLWSSALAVCPVLTDGMCAHGYRGHSQPRNNFMSSFFPTIVACWQSRIQEGGQRESCFLGQGVADRA